MARNLDSKTFSKYKEWYFLTWNDLFDYNKPPAPGTLEYLEQLTAEFKDKVFPK